MGLSRNEDILQSIVDGTQYTDPPKSRVEDLLLQVKEVIEEGGGGGTDDYNDLTNQPKINNNTLVGNKTASDLGLVAAETGKGLSSNDYTDEDKAIVGGVTAALAGKQGALTAGDYISIDAQNNISVNRDIVPHQTSYRIKGTGRDTMNITKYIDGVQESSTDYVYSQGTTRTIDDAFTINDTYSSAGYIWQFVWLKDSTTHDKDYTVAYRSYEGAFDFTEVFNDEDLSGYKLVIKSEMDTALALKQNATDNSLDTDAKTIVGAINEHEGDISSLKSGLTNYENQNNLNLEVPNRKNLCDNGKNSVGYYDQTGTYQDSVHYATSDLIPVEQGKTYVASLFNKTTSERVGALVYSTWDASKNFVAQSTSTSITIGSGVSYVRIRNFQDQTTYIDGDNFVYQLEQGSTATAYAPYIPSVESRIEAVESGMIKITKESYENITVDAGSKKYVTNVGLLTDNIVVTAYSNNSNVITYVATGTTTYQVYLYNPTNAAITNNVTVMVAKV